MFESLKKKFSRTSNKLTEELTEEAKEENNIEDSKEEIENINSDDENNDSNNDNKPSFFSTFSRKKDEEEEDVKTDSVEQIEEVTEERTDFFSELAQKKDEKEESGNNKEIVEDSKKEESSSFFSKFKRNKEEKVDETDEEEIAETETIGDETEEIVEDENSGFLSKYRKPKDKDDSNKSGIFSFIKEKTISEKHVEDILFELEMGLLEGDVAMDVANTVVDSVKNDLIGQKIKRSSDIEEYTYDALKNAVSKIIDVPGKSMTEMIEDKKAKGEPLVVMFVGINGTGKTTTIGKIANYYINKGYTPVIAAADTFRAGAIEQVTHHADNLGVKIIKHQKGSDPAAVAYDAVEHAKSKGKELVLIDTAGRMQNNTNLMDEMKKINRVAKPDLVVFVGDALTGNDATEQASKFNDAIGVDGVILTKADADSKGGASLSIGYVIKKPILFLGMGQSYDDIKEYDAEWMLGQLFSSDTVIENESE
ncbi:signal recognition particle-docking protein FtsY [Methanobrevibacter sp. DSM 116169]|uniref:signal recognition particle-docking protein FtsY n=1 Tax=Methanobrevibacter sp. DSM 116169 TaxID=3242727 RepID=UPI0038FCD68B